MEYKRFNDHEKLRPASKVTGWWYDGTPIHGWPDIVMAYVCMCLFTTIGFLMGVSLLHMAPIPIQCLLVGVSALIVYGGLTHKVGFWRTTRWLLGSAAYLVVFSFTPLTWWGLLLYGVAVLAYSARVTYALQHERKFYE